MPDINHGLTPDQWAELVDGLRELRKSNLLLSQSITPSTPSFWRTWGPTLLGCLVSALLVAGPSYISTRERLTTLENKNSELERRVSKNEVDIDLNGQRDQSRIDAHLQNYHMGRR